MKKYMIVPAPFLFTLLIAGLIWNTEAAPDTDSPQQDMWDLGTEQANDLKNDAKPTERVKAELISKWLMIGSIISGMFLIIILFYDVWEAIRRRRLKQIHQQLEKER